MNQMSAILLRVENTEGKKQKCIFKKKRGGIVLTKEQVAAIKEGRKLLRKELKSRGIKEKKEFELTAAQMGLYFDKGRLFLFLKWLFFGRGLWALLGLIALLTFLLFIFSTITQLKGHFTINMSDDMFREGFILCETPDFKNPSTTLFATPAEDVPCISISNLPRDIDEKDGEHNENCFAYTFYLKNDGESTVTYNWQIALNSESRKVSEAAWLMLFQDGEMMFYAKPDKNGEIQTLPARDDNTRGYINLKLAKYNAEPDLQYEIIAQKNDVTYYRVVPFPFVDEDIMAEGVRTGCSPEEVHKYTVVIWLEGDDPDCTDELIGGHVGMEMRMQLIDVESEDDENGIGALDWKDIWDGLQFWLE